MLPGIGSWEDVVVVYLTSEPDGYCSYADSKLRALRLVFSIIFSWRSRSSDGFPCPFSVPQYPMNSVRVLCYFVLQNHKACFAQWWCVGWSYGSTSRPFGWFS